MVRRGKGGDGDPDTRVSEGSDGGRYTDVYVYAYAYVCAYVYVYAYVYTYVYRP